MFQQFLTIWQKACGCLFLTPVSTSWTSEKTSKLWICVQCNVNMFYVWTMGSKLHSVSISIYACTKIMLYCIQVWQVQYVQYNLGVIHDPESEQKQWSWFLQEAVWLSINKVEQNGMPLFYLDWHLPGSWNKNWKFTYTVMKSLGSMCQSPWLDPVPCFETMCNC